jgi:hypothetical protein
MEVWRLAGPLGKGSMLGPIAMAFALSLRPSAATAQPNPLPAHPPPDFSTTQRALSQAYAAVQRAYASNAAHAGTNAPILAGATQANFLYAEALARYRAGDRASAYYDAALATGLANEAAAGRTVIEPLHLNPPPNYYYAPTPPVPGIPTVLPNELLRARNEIERVEQLTGDPLSAATAKYRAALDRYFSGDLSAAKADADAAYDLTEQALKAHAKH